MDYTSFAPGKNSIKNSTPPPAPQYSAPEHKHFLNKKFIITIVILALVGANVYVDIWDWQNQQTAQEVAPTFTPRTDATAGWQVYTNMQYGFEFKYPTTYKTVIPGVEQGGWSQGIILLIPTAGAQSYYLAVEKWPNEGSVPKDRLGTFSKYNRGTYYITVWNINDEPVVDQIISTFKFMNQGQIVCTQEAKQCSDGSYVSRTGPNCEFTACPGGGTLTGHVTIGPNCPVEQVGNPCTPSPQAYTSRQVMVYKADGTTLVTTQNFDTQGNYNIALPFGTYVVKSRTGISSITSVVGTVTIKIGQISTLNFNIDTGIR